LNNHTNQAVPGGWSLREIIRDIWVAWRLLWDPQVSSLLKIALPVMALAYWISPVDLLPGLPFDDFAVILVASRLFVNMVPKDALARALHPGEDEGIAAWFRRQAASGSAPGSASGSSGPEGDDDVVDTTWRVIDEE